MTVQINFASLRFAMTHIYLIWFCPDCSWSSSNLLFFGHYILAKHPK